STTSFQYAAVLDLLRGGAQSSVAGQHRRLSAIVRIHTPVVVGECPHMDGEAKKTTFQLILIKPTHYDDDGYPITWLRSHIPSNTLAALYGLGEDCRQRQALGPDVDIVTRPFDETNVRVRPDRIIADIKRAGGRGLICLVGVQSNQFPRAVDLARHFLKAGLPVALGGFHAA